MSVIVLILPGADDPAGGPGSVRAPRTYHFSLTTDLRTATVEINGQGPMPARIQRVRPGAGVPAPSATAPARLGWNGDPTAAGIPEIPLGKRARSADRTLSSQSSRYPGPGASLAPNGAPIID